MSLQGKYALVTGSSRGIGRGIALKLAEKGVNVAVNYRQNKEAAEATLAEVRRLGVKGILVHADVTQPDQLSRLFSEVRAEFGQLDIFVANALGDLFSVLAPPMNLTVEQLSAAHASQGQAFLASVQAAAQLMPDGGRIIAITYAPGANTGSWQAYSGQGTGKAALESLCRYFAVALAKRRITVNAISPGFIEDSILNALPTAVQEMVRSHHAKGWTPMGRLGTPEDIGNAVAMISTVEASWITGQTIKVDGGSSLMSPELPLEIQLG